MPVGNNSTFTKPGSRLRELGLALPKGADALGSLCRDFRGRLAALSERDASGGGSQTLHHGTARRKPLCRRATPC
jgi:hypothetical protein